jgi:hypothetical protein
MPVPVTGAAFRSPCRGLPLPLRKAGFLMCCVNARPSATLAVPVQVAEILIVEPIRLLPNTPACLGAVFITPR